MAETAEFSNGHDVDPGKSTATECAKVLIGSRVQAF